MNQSVQVLIIGSILFPLGCGSDSVDPELGPNPEVVVSSADGAMSLMIPAGALPAGVTAADITISDVSDSHGYTITEGDPPLAVIRLEPEGLQFSQPVVLTTGPTPVDDPPPLILFVHVSDEAAEITDADIDIDAVTNTFVASIPLTHFSDLLGLTVAHPLSAVVTESASTVLVGQTFTVSVAGTRLVAGETGRVLRSGDLTLDFEMADAPFTIQGSMEGFGGTFRPSRIEDVPALTAIGRTFTVAPQTFECFRVTQGFIQYRVEAKFTLTGPDSGGNPFRLRDRVWFLSGGVECVMPNLVATDEGLGVTEYRLSQGITAATSYSWSGHSCGFTILPFTDVMAWFHSTDDDPNCEHQGEGHPEATITLIITGTLPVSGNPFELTCTYPGALTGSGPKCTQGDLP